MKNQTKLKVLTNDTGFILAQWKFMSKRKEACGILGCLYTPVIKCDHCANYYCIEHQWVLSTPGHPLGK